MRQQSQLVPSNAWTILSSCGTSHPPHIDGMGYSTILTVVTGAKWVILSNGNEELFASEDGEEDLYDLAYKSDTPTQLVVLEAGDSL
jgi:hypothetical protein